MLNDLALKAGEKRLSPVTGFVHLGDTIPLFENLCYALALMKRKTTASFQAGEALLERLLPFHAGTNFPRFLHTYPKPSTLSFDLPLMKMHQEFSRLLKRDLTPYFTQVPPLHFNTPYDTSLMCPVAHDLPQEGLEPALTLQDLYMGGKLGVFTPRILKDHPLHLHAAYLDEAPLTSTSQFYQYQWAGKEHIHSLAANYPLIEGSFSVGEEDLEVHIDLLSMLTVNQEKSTTFHLGDTLQIHTPFRIVELKFMAQEGTFFGSISRKNRPLQKLEGVFDWCLTLRKLSDHKNVKIDMILN